MVSFARDPHPANPAGVGVAAALKVAAELGRVQPDWAAKLAQIEVLGEEDFRLHTDALPFPLLVTAGQVGPKVQRLVELLPELTQRYTRIEAVDLRFSRRIVVQPSQTLLSLRLARVVREKENENGHWEMYVRPFQLTRRPRITAVKKM